MKKFIVLITMCFVLSGCGSKPVISDLKDFKGCEIKYAEAWYRGQYTSITAYCNGVFKKGVIPFRTHDVKEIQKMVDDIKEEI